MLRSWSLQRLVSMLQDTQSKEKDAWKDAPLSTSNGMKDISSDHRDQAVKWIAELNVQFNFHPETFFLATNILDRFFTVVKAQPKYLKCIAISCFYLASKINEEEDVIPCTGELVEDSGCGFRCCDVLRMERIVLEKLSWDINSPTPLQYLHIFQVLTFFHFTDLATTTSAPHQLSLLTGDLIHAMCLYKVACFPNAAIALAIFSLELESITGSAGKWTTITGQLQTLAKVKTCDLMQCREFLYDVLPQTTFYFNHFQPAEQSVKQTLPFETPTCPKKMPTNIMVSKLPLCNICSTLSSSQENKAVDIRKSNAKDVEMGIGLLEYDSDKTMTASEGEESCDDEPEEFAKPLRTYAEIVKWGQSPQVFHGEGCNSENLSEHSPTVLPARCSSQANYQGIQQTLFADQLTPSLQG